MTQPAFLLDVLAEEQQELLERGIQLTPPEEMNQAQRDAWVSDLLRVLGETERELAQMEETRTAEHARVDMRWNTNVDGPRRRALTLRQAIHALALDADFGKKKSRELTWGTYGRKQVPAKITIVDEQATLAWAQTSAPQALKLTITTTGDWALAQWASMNEEMRTLFAGARPDVSKSKLNELVKSSGEEPPGVLVEAAHDEPFAKTAGA